MRRTLLLFFSFVIVAEAIVCPPNFCNDMTCEELSCEKGQVLKEKGGFCGCCNKCVTVLGKFNSISFREVSIIKEQGRLAILSYYFWAFNKLIASR